MCHDSFQQRRRNAKGDPSIKFAEPSIPETAGRGNTDRLSESSEHVYTTIGEFQVRMTFFVAKRNKNDLEMTSILV